MRLVLGLILTLILVSCSNSGDTIEDDFGVSGSTSSSSGSVTVAGGLIQVSTANPTMNTSATLALKVKALDEANEPKSGETITFELNGSTGGRLSSTSVSSDGNGIAQVIFTAPAAAENPTVLVTSEIGTATFNITVGSASSSGPSYSDVSFDGVDSATVIDDNTVRLFFPSPTGGSGINGYNIYLDSDFSTVHQSFGLGAYSTDSASGNLYVDVVGLTAATAYDFTVRHLDILQGLESAETNTVTTTTAAAVSAFWD